MKRLIMAAFAAVLSITVQAQEQPAGFLPSYIVGVNGDTTHGFLKATGEATSCNSATFLKPGQDPKTAIKYKPGQIKSYYRYGNLFVTLPKGNHFVFAELAEKGKMNLYAVYSTNSGSSGGGVMVPMSVPGGSTVMMVGGSPEHRTAQAAYYLQKPGVNGGAPQMVNEHNINKLAPAFFGDNADFEYDISSGQFDIKYIRSQVQRYNGY